MTDNTVYADVHQAPDGTQYKFEIVREIDMDVGDPRQADNLGTMLLWIRGYSLGDRNPYELIEEFNADWNGDNALIFPVYGYIHSGIALSLSNAGYPFNCPWDSGTAGVIYASLEDIKSAGLDRDRAAAVLQSEIDDYNKYLAGDVYYYSIKEIERCLHCGALSETVTDACTGFLGHDFENNGIMDEWNALKGSGNNGNGTHE